MSKTIGKTYEEEDFFSCEGGLSSMKKQELFEMAVEAGLDVNVKMNKPELIAVIEAVGDDI